MHFEDFINLGTFTYRIPPRPPAQGNIYLCKVYFKKETVRVTERRKERESQTEEGRIPHLSLFWDIWLCNWLHIRLSNEQTQRVCLLDNVCLMASVQQC